MEKKKRIIRREGSIIKVPFDPPFHTYARALPHESYAFYDFRTDTDIPDLDLIISKPVLFICGVSRFALRDRYWDIVGFRPLEENLKVLPLFCKKNNSLQEEFSIDDNGITRKASKDECIGLEFNLIWQPHHIEQRLNEHFAGLPSSTIAFMKKHWGLD